MTAFRDLMRTRITCNDEDPRKCSGYRETPDWCVRLDGHLLSSYWNRHVALQDALQCRQSLSGLKEIVLDRVSELGRMVHEAVSEDRLDEAVTLCDERAQLLSCFLLIRQAWAERLAQNEDAAPNVHAVLREMQEAARAAF